MQNLLAITDDLLWQFRLQSHAADRREVDGGLQGRVEEAQQPSRAFYGSQRLQDE